MLIAQMQENKALQARLDAAERELESRRICIESTGSLAEAALALNGVFQAADAASQQYLENIQAISSQQESTSQEIQAKAEQKAAHIIREAQEYSQKAHQEADDYWQFVRSRVVSAMQSPDPSQAFSEPFGKNQ